MKSPFKFLDSYTREDREIFFGREKEIEELFRRLFESRVLLVYGESGTGKSSLINCGLINKLSANEHLPIYIRRSDNILESLSEAIQILLKESIPHQLLTALLFKKALREISDDFHKHLIFVFDQFEELFIFGTKEEKQSLVQVLKVLVESDIDCRFIFIVREEYFSNVAEFEKHIPNFLSNRMRIEKMNRTNAIAAIKGSCSVNDIQVEDGFAENLLRKLNPDSPDIELTWLQIFLDKVFNYEVNKDWKFEGDLPCLIDFYADWCRPCKMVAPIMEEYAKEYSGKIRVFKVNTDAEPELAQLFQIRSIPSVMFVPKTGKPQMTVGALPKESFTKIINEFLLVK